MTVFCLKFMACLYIPAVCLSRNSVRPLQNSPFYPISASGQIL
jgi:hypothetical protein